MSGIEPQLVQEGLRYKGGMFQTSLNPASLLDLNTLTASSRFEIVLATPNETNPNEGAVFGSGNAEGASPNGGNFGTANIDVAPALRITAVVIPEPATFTLAGCAGLAFLLLRKRR